MATRKRNEWLDADSEEEVENEYESEAQEESRGALAGRSIKRRRVDQDSEDDYSDEEPSSMSKTSAQSKNEANDVEDEDLDDAPAHPITEALKPTTTTSSHSTKPKQPTVKPLTAKQVLASQRAAKKTGVIYLSRVPPFMKPTTLKHFLDPHAPQGLGRIFLTPEDSVSHKQRVRSGGNKKRSFTDGWVEFISKNDAKIAAETLNANTIGGRKGNFYYDDVWNIKYLKGFKWSHLTEQIANENAERAARLRAEISRTRKENREFVADVERGKMVEGIKAKKAARAEASGLAGARAGCKDGDAGGGGGDGGTGRKELKRTFKQNAAKSKKGADSAVTGQAEAVLSRLF